MVTVLYFSLQILFKSNFKFSMSMCSLHVLLTYNSKESYYSCMHLHSKFLCLLLMHCHFRSGIVMTRSPAYERTVVSQQPSEVSKLETNPAYIAINREFHLYERVENFHQPPHPQSTCCEYEIPQR